MGSVTGRPPRGLFVGLCTLDVVQLVDRVPASDEKVTARDQVVAAGGPAANAAVAFRHLGGAATLLTGVGRHPLALAAKADLTGRGVTVVDLAPQTDGPPSVSSILVTASTGARAVASTNAAGMRLAAPAGLDALIAECDVVHLDGHHMELALTAAERARAEGRPVLLDGGSWKPGTAALLPYVEAAVCSADFHPPGTRGPAETLVRLHAHGVPWAAVSRGPDPLLWSGPGSADEIPVAPVPVVDTLGAGDTLHGAFARHFPRGAPTTPEGFVTALARAVATASASCTAFGTRAWLDGG